MAEDKNEVDFIARKGLNDDLLKIYNEFDDNPLYHLTIKKLYTLLNLPKGKHRFFPDLGMREEFYKLINMEEDQLASHFSNMERTIKEVIDLDVDIDYDVMNSDSGINSHLEIYISVKQLPSKVLVTVPKSGKRTSKPISMKLIN